MRQLSPGFNVILLVVVVFIPFYSLQAQTGLRLNELAAVGSPNYLDEDHDDSDWLELFNAHSEALNLKGYRLSDRPDWLSAWELPDTVIAAGGYLPIWASGKDRVQSDKYIIEAGGGGIWEWSGRDGFHFEYLEVNGEFDVRVRVHSLRDRDERSRAGLMLRDALTASSSYTAIFSRDNDNFRFLHRAESGQNGRRRIALDKARLPWSWLRLLYAKDTLRAFISHDSYCWRQVDSAAFKASAGRFFVGLAVSSGDQNIVSRASFSDLILNDQKLSFDQLTAQTFESDQPGRGFASRELHCDFKLSQSRETVYLWDPAGNLLDSLAYSGLRAGLSFGRLQDAAAKLGYSELPSPGRPNQVGEPALSAAPLFSQAGGLYDEKLTLEILSPDDDTRVFYTTDGAEPDTNATLASGKSLSISRNTVVRARAYSKARLPGRIVSHTYLLGHRQDLPVVALATDPKNFFDEDRGIYIKGPNASPDFPYFGANFWRDWERPVHIEFWEIDGRLAFAQDAGVRLHGVGSRLSPQKSLRLYARGNYGPANFDYQLFPDKAINSFRRFLLRNAGQDWPYAFMRDALTAILAQSMGLDVMAYRPTEVFLNGEYWGIHNLRERIDQYYLAANHDLDPASVSILEQNSNIRRGSCRDYMLFLDTMRLFDDQPELQRELAERHIDVANFIDYYSIEIYTDNQDWPGNNSRYWKSDAPGSRWRWLVFDTDAGLGYGKEVSNNTFDRLASPVQTSFANPLWSTYLFRSLIRDNKFRYDFINRMADHLNTNLHAVHAHSVIDSVAAMLRPAITRQQERWDTLYDWESNVQKIKDYTLERIAWLRFHYVKQFDLGGEAKIQLKSNLPEGLRYEISTLENIKAPWTGIYFQDVPISIRVKPRPGYAFVGWQDIEAGDSELSVTIQGDTCFTALLEWRGPQVVINEIMYNAAPERPTRDWVELFNCGSSAVDLGGWTLRDAVNAADHIFTIPSGTRLPAGDYLLLCRERTAFRQYHPDQTAIIGDIPFGFGSASGDDIRLFDSQGSLVDSVPYRVSAPWPAEANGLGASLELIDPKLDNTEARSWRASALDGGSPLAPTDRASDTADRERVVIRNFSIQPNPGRGPFLLSFTLTRPTALRVELVDNLGRPVANIAERQFLVPGLHTLQFAAESLPTGIYHCLLRESSRSNSIRGAFQLIIHP